MPFYRFGGSLPLIWMLLVLPGAFRMASASESAGFNHDHYAEVLNHYVDDHGRVDYRGLKGNRDSLDAYLSAMSRIGKSEYQSWSEADKIAFWLNAYNARTLQVVIDNYPIQAGFFGSLRFPSNSIRQISGVWDKLKSQFIGKDYTLDAIEHEILRKQFHEPRIHMALVCASVGCPFLRNEPYLGSRLDEQLEDQARKFLDASQNFHVEDGTVYLSSIFKWFGEDFSPKYTPAGGFDGYSQSGKAVLNFISQHISEDQAAKLAQGGFDIEYLDYDWSLNEK